MVEIGAADAVVADDLSLAYGTGASQLRALDGVSLRVPSGGSLALVGDAGSGKSTLAKAIAGQLWSINTGASNIGGRPPRVVGGSLRVFGTELRGATARERRSLALGVGYVPQDAGSTLVPHLTVGQNVADPIYTRRPDFDRVEAGTAVARLIDAVRLPLATMTLFPHELSRGQRQRVAFAKALILEPRLFVADDPTLGVDVLVRPRVLAVLNELRRELGFAMLVIGHDLTELGQLAEQLAVLQAGRVLALGGLDEVLDSTHSGYLGELAKLRRRPSHAG